MFYIDQLGIKVIDFLDKDIVACNFKYVLYNQFYDYLYIKCIMKARKMLWEYNLKRIAKKKKGFISYIDGWGE